MKKLNECNDPIEREFKKREPWITRFTIEGKEYGGDYRVEGDTRIAQFNEAFPMVQSILDLGSLEGGQTFQLARRPGVFITAVEARRANVDKSRYIQQLLGVRNVRFIQADLERTLISTFGQFDAIFCSGVLYHLARPWHLIDGFRSASRHVFIWTQYAAEETAIKTLHGFPGHWYREHGMKDPLSGTSSRSFWITLPALVQRLKENGFEHIEVLANDPKGKNGPSVTMTASIGDG